jgi:hypothetical protein
MDDEKNCSLPICNEKIAAAQFLGQLAFQRIPAG